MISEASRQRLERPQAGHTYADAPAPKSEYSEVQCRSCGALVVWVKTKLGKSMPIDAHTARFGDSLYDSKAGHISHFATCPNAAQHRKKS